MAVQTTALLLGLTASHFSKEGAMVGLEFWLPSRSVRRRNDPPRVARGSGAAE